MPLKTASAARVALRLMAIILMGALLWLITAFQFFYSPPQGVPQRTDAIVVLGGLSRERLPVAEDLQKSLDIPVLVVSTTGLAGNIEGDTLCRDDSDDPDLMCFRPSPLNTRGEAKALGELIAQNGWESVTVVTSEYHVVRAGTLIRQCTSAEVHMVGSKPDLSAGAWVDRFIVETGGLIDAWVQPECRG